MGRQKGLQLIELVLAMVILSGIVLTGNMMFTGFTNRAMAVQAQAEMGDELAAVFRRLDNFFQDIQPEVLDSANLYGLNPYPTLLTSPVSPATPYLQTADPLWWATPHSSFSMTLFSYPPLPTVVNPTPSIVPKLITFSIASSDPDDSEGRYKEGSLSIETNKSNPRNPEVLSSHICPYAVVKNYNHDLVVGDSGGQIPPTAASDLGLINACIQALTVAACTDVIAGDRIWPGFEISQDRKRIYASFRMKRKVGSQTIVSKPMTKMYFIRGEKVQ